MEREAALGEGKSSAEDWMLHPEALTLACSGRARRAGKCHSTLWIWLSNPAS